MKRRASSHGSYTLSASLTNSLYQSYPTKVQLKQNSYNELMIIVNTKNKLAFAYLTVRKDKVFYNWTYSYIGTI